MATESSKPSSRDESSDSGSGSDSENETQSAATPTTVEWLATGRAKRSTAGNRMKSMLANEEPDSDLELLFAEDDNDEGFTDVDDGGSDVQMDSSSDDEDEQNQGDDMEGEKELEKQAREKKAAARKRKAQEVIPAKFRKKVRIDANQYTAPAPRPKKKSERSSWLPSPADMPVRASSRQTTVLSKEQLHQQMKEREAKRLKQAKAMEKKAQRQAESKKPPMTQAERLAEAAIVEKRNSKSLNRWEEAEKAREEERLAKIAALQNRTLKGPVVTYWSGLGEWEHHLKHVGRVAEEEKPVRKKREKKEKPEKGKGKEKDGKEGEKAEEKKGEGPTATATPRPETTPLKPADGQGESKPEAPSAPSVSTTGDAPQTNEPPKPEEQPPSEVARSAFILRNFDEDLIKDKTTQTQILFGRRMDRLAKPAPRPVCVITAHPARYRDPDTGLPYYDVRAYREIQRLRRGEYKWSSLLGAWVGSCNYAARGVPERFLKDNGKPKPKPKEKEVDVTIGAPSEKQEGKEDKTASPPQEGGKEQPETVAEKQTVPAPSPSAPQTPQAPQAVVQTPAQPQTQEAKPAATEPTTAPVAASVATPV
ncbi:hypothetical protein K4K55_006848 [Colletotrichum sp. SAR 10_96]|nr:hypothetical protein K4K55_006848 [Colletotrichum sp. SAR 10_96]